MIRCEATGDHGVLNEGTREKIKALAPRNDGRVWQLNGDWAIIKGELYDLDDSLKGDLRAKHPDDCPDKRLRGKPAGLAQYFKVVMDDAKSVHGVEKSEGKTERGK